MTIPKFQHDLSQLMDTFALDNLQSSKHPHAQTAQFAILRMSTLNGVIM